MVHAEGASAGRRRPHVAPPVADERYRILVVADTHGVASDLAEALRSHARGRPASVFVIAPALESRLGRLTSDQNGYDDAARRLMILFVTHRERQTNWLEEGVVEFAESRYHNRSSTSPFRDPAQWSHRCGGVTW